MNDTHYTLRHGQTGLYFGIINGRAGFIGDLSDAKIFSYAEHGPVQETISRLRFVFSDVKWSDIHVKSFRTEPVEVSVEDNVRRFCAELDTLLAEHESKIGFNLYVRRTSVREGKKYFRVCFTEDGRESSIWFLVDRDTGLCYKPAGFSGGPANKIVRGDVSKPASDYWNRSISPYGLASAR